MIALNRSGRPRQNIGQTHFAEDVKRITRPEAVLTIDDIDRQQVTIVLGKGTAQDMKARR